MLYACILRCSSKTILLHCSCSLSLTFSTSIRRSKFLLYSLYPTPCDNCIAFSISLVTFKSKVLIVNHPFKFVNQFCYFYFVYSIPFVFIFKPLIKKRPESQVVFRYVYSFTGTTAPSYSSRMKS